MEMALALVLVIARNALHTEPRRCLPQCFSHAVPKHAVAYRTQWLVARSAFARVEMALVLVIARNALHTEPRRFLPQCFSHAVP